MKATNSYHKQKPCSVPAHKRPIFQLFFTLFLFLNIGTTAYAQKSYTKYWVSFTDKQNTNHSLSNPETFLSQRAIERRMRFQIPLTNNDLPVSYTYLQKLRQKGVKVLYTSKWFNGTIVSIQNPKLLKRLEELPFVKEVKPVGRDGRKKKTLTSGSAPSIKLKTEEKELPKESTYYGAAFHQTKMLKGDYLHAQGFTGRGMLVAVTDAGFSNVEKMEVFRHLYEEERIAGTYDFVDIDQNPYHDSTHGTHVLSTIAAKIPNQFVGTAPDASFWLFRTEDNKSETHIEEYNWVAAAEMADSAGVDVLNTSLGYVSFDDKEMSYQPEELDGNTAIITRGADIAASKGILVVVSAGNKGNKQWKHLTTPADADSVLTVGAVNKREKYAFFSSQGFGVDHNIKPNVMAQGQSSETVTIDGTIRPSNGTSFSAPIMAGLVTCLLQANPQQNPQKLITTLQESASQYNNPSQTMGYGVPDFQRSHLQLSSLQSPINSSSKEATAFVYPNPFDDTKQVYYYAPRSETITLQLLDLTGKLYQEYQSEVRKNEPYKFYFSAWQSAPKGIYVVRIGNSEERFSLRAVKASD
ncbi:MAG: S8 family serine peptidase [Chitinophagales bacterium]